MNERITQRNKRYSAYVDSVSPKTSMMKSLLHSFLVGGLICVFGQLLGDLYRLALPEMDKAMIINFVSMTLIALAIFATGLGWYDILARVGGAGAFLPITGFANAIGSTSMEFKTEGLIFGTSVKMFTIVGPVIVNGVVWSTLAGFLHQLIFEVIL